MTFDYKQYRESRYQSWGNSWRWSYNENARFKAEVINVFIQAHAISSVIEVWCGDGNNLALYECQEYLWLDISPTIVDYCKWKFYNDTTKRFELYDHSITEKADLTLCLDVTYHIFPREEWEKTIKKTIKMANKYAIFYSFPAPNWHAMHINNYNFEEYLFKYCKRNKYEVEKLEITPPDSNSRFYIVKK